MPGQNISVETIIIKDLPVRYFETESGIFFCLTDLAKSADTTTDVVMQSYLKNANNIEFLSKWEEMYNPGFNPHRLVGIKTKLGLNNFYLSMKKWIETVGAIGIVSEPGRYGGTYAQEEITIQFMNWLDVEFYLYFIAEFKRLKTDEGKRLGHGWDLRRELSKANYAIQTHSIRENLVPLLDWNTKREAIYFASEADLLNVALFGMSAQQWRLLNPDAKGNMRDRASETELHVLANLESQNATLIEMGFTQEERLSILSRRGKRELEILLETKAIKELKHLGTSNKGELPGQA
jgi:hypothetical protein